MAFRTTSSSTAVSWEEVMEWSKNLAAKIKAGPDADVKSIFPVDHEDIIPCKLITNKKSLLPLMMDKLIMIEKLQLQIKSLKN